MDVSLLDKMSKMSIDIAITFCLKWVVSGKSHKKLSSALLFGGALRAGGLSGGRRRQAAIATKATEWERENDP
jgi:hypothetical protein